MKKNQWLSYEEAREFARKLNLNNLKQWQEWSKSGMRPQNIPASPNQVYKGKGWNGYGDFLGMGKNRKGDFLPFEEARKFTRTLRMRNFTQWNNWSKSGMRPQNIPASPNQVYKGKGWKSWGDWLGTKNKSYRYIKFASFEESRKFAHSLNLKSSIEWEQWSKSGMKPQNIPAVPDTVYKNKGWINWKDFLGLKNKQMFLSFEEAKKYVQSLNLKNIQEWKEWSKSGKRPQNIPADPYSVYKKIGRISYSDFLGTGRIAFQKRKYLSFEEAREFARKLNLNNIKQWREWSKSGMRPENIPSAPDRTYKNKGWISWYDFFGTK